MGRTPVAARRHGDLARIGLGVGEELRSRLGQKRWMYHHNEGYAADTCDRRDVADDIEIELVVERRINRVKCTGQYERIAIRGSAHDRLGADIAATAWPVLNDELLTEPLRQPLTHQARGDVERAAGRRANDYPHRPRRIALRPRDGRAGWDRNSARGQMKK